MAGCLLAGAPLAAQTLEDGVLLVATPELGDPNFARTVVLVLRHDDNGTLGVVINRITTLDPTIVFPELAAGLEAYDGTLFRGGPISPTRVLYLVRGPAAAAVEGPQLFDDVRVSGDPDALGEVAALAAGQGELRLYAGHAEWAAGQVEREIREGHWQIKRGSAALVFHANPRYIWEDASSYAAEVVVDARR